MTDKKHENSTPSKTSEAKAPPQPPKQPAATQAQAPQEPAKPGPTEKGAKGTAEQPTRTEKPGPGGPGGGQVPPKDGPTQPPPRKGGRGLAFLALLIALGAAGGSAYLWYRWYEAQQAEPGWSAELNTRLDQTMSEVAEQRKAALQDLKNQLQAQQEEVKQALNSEIQTLKSEIQSLNDSIQARKGDAQTLRNQLSSLESELQNLESQLNSHIQEQQQTLAQIENRIENLQLGQRGLTNSLEAVKAVAARGGDVNALPLSEVEYLLRVAHHKLQFQGDVGSALNALNIAKKRLEAVGEDAFNSVLQMINEDIATLRGIDLPDRSALAHQIFEMQQQVDGLPIQIETQMALRKEEVQFKATEGEKTQAAAEPEELPWWERAAHTAWQEIKDIIVIRHERTAGPPLIAVEEEYFLRQNLRLELEAIRLALLRGDASSYQESIELVREWTKTYFDTNDEQVQNVLSKLQGLQKVQLHPYIPDISDTLKAFREVMERREPVRSVVPTLGAAKAGPTEEATKGLPEEGGGEAKPKEEQQ